MSFSERFRLRPPGSRREVVVIGVGIAVVVVAAVATIIAVGARPTTPTYSVTTVSPAPSLKVGSPLPTTPAVHELVGTKLSSIATVAAHRPAVINFFASYCTLCAQEMHTFATVANSEHAVAFIGVDTTDPNVAKARSLVTQAGVAYPVLEDNGASSILNAFGVAALPTTFFVNASGTVTKIVLGIENATQLRANIRRYASA